MTYTGSLALRLTGAEELLARSAAFRARVGAGTVAQAKERVYCGELTLDDVLAMLAGGTLEVARPCAILGVQRHSYTQLGQGAALTLGASGGVWVLFSDNPRTGHDHKTSLLDFTDWISAVMDEVAALVATDIGAANYTLWPFHRIELFFEPYRPDVADRETDDFWLGGYLLFDHIDGS